jgi:indole-3-glycerol phosphate synthase
VSGTRLDPIVADVRRRSEERRRWQPLERLKELVREDSWRRERFLAGFRKTPGRLDFIAEMKRRSPSAGVLLAEGEDPRSTLPTRGPRPGPRWFALAHAYREAGAAAISVLTEEDHFAGSLDDLRAVEFTRLPRLRKDFVVDEGMLWESCLFGADAVLLLAAILQPGELATLRNIARDLGLAVLLEVHDERELDLAASLEPELLGINARDLATFEVDLATVERLLPLAPAGPKAPILVAESGIRGIDDLRRVRAAGAEAVLVGEALVRSGDAGKTLAEWKAALDG